MATSEIEIGAAPRKRRRVALWTLVIWTGFCVAWVISGANATDCSSEIGDKFLSASDAQSACQVGEGAAIGVIFLVWAFITFIIMAITVIVRLSQRDR